ncbi:CTC-interacting domain 7 [Striga hermonthica]|uniref:CTC-interacting domain 7 n=1 Tax=Striga hermonthica TaxID=68872 RepID=A0A9N7NLB9_STRHE|nr:CTC-interacting domain 7 [Striga hermonthica]
MENNEKVVNLLGKEASIGNSETSYAKKETLNPNAREFVPLGVISSSKASPICPTSIEATPEKSTLDRSESSISKKSDEEAHQYWHHQLPDDLTPDFEATGLDNTSQEINGLSFSSLSLMDGKEHSALEQQGLSSHLFNGNNYVGKQRIGVSSCGERRALPLGFRGSFDKHWDKRIGNDGRLLAKDGYSYYGDSRVDFCSDVSNEQLMMENQDLSTIEFLASRFPGFSAERLMEVYFANGGDLNLTIEMLTQLEVEMYGGFNQTLNSKNLPATNLSGSNFPALCVTNVQNGLGKDCTPFSSPFPSSQSRGAINFASAVEKMASQDSSIWAYEKKGSSVTSVGSSRSLQLLGSSYNSGQGRGIYSKTVQNCANMYSEIWEEARDHARLRNAYFEKARQAYQIGNKSLAKDLIIKGQMHNMWMKAAHEKAQESIFRQRNMNMRAQVKERMIDLHGLHVNEALHVLRRELAVLRHVARSAEQGVLVYICLGTGQHTKDPCTLTTLPTAVQIYLLEEEGLDFSEPQQGLLQVLLF